VVCEDRTELCVGSAKENRRAEDSNLQRTITQILQKKEQNDGRWRRE